MDKKNETPKAWHSSSPLYTSFLYNYHRNMPETRSETLAKSKRALGATGHHYNTLEKARFKQAISEFEHNRPTSSTRCKADIFRRFNIPKPSAYRLLAESSDRRTSHQEEHEETRGRPSKVTPQQLQKCEHIVTSFGYQGRSLTWEQLAFEADINVSSRTIRRAMGTMDYRRCIACRKAWVSPQLAEKRKTFAALILEKYPYKKD